MASNKIYIVVKDGKELEQLKTLATAKKLADTEGAEVYCDGKCVYRGVVETESIKAEPVVSRKPVQPDVEDVQTERYRLRALMNVRKRPSLDSTILGTKVKGTVVRVLKVEKDWLCLADGTYIFYEGGKWAEKIGSSTPAEKG